MKCFVLALILTIAALASDFDELRATQQKLVAARDGKKLPRDEVPPEEVALAKRQLLLWAESRLQSFGREVDPGDLTRALARDENGCRNSMWSRPLGLSLRMAKQP